MTVEPDRGGAPEYEVYAIKYAELKARPATDIFIGADPHQAPVDMNYYVWLVRSASTAVLVDMGFTRAVGERRGRRFLRCPTDGLRALGVDPDAIRHVVVTHMHYDHVGNYALFPRASFHLQDKEMSYATGRMMQHRCLCAAYEPEDVVEVVRHVFGRRVSFHDGDEEILPGLSLHLAPGHTAGLQFVRVRTRRGWLVLASDACHYYRHLEQNSVFPQVYDVGELVEGYKRLRGLASDPSMIVPGHDPEVAARYPLAEQDASGMSYRLD